MTQLTHERGRHGTLAAEAMLVVAAVLIRLAVTGSRTRRARSGH